MFNSDMLYSRKKLLLEETDLSQELSDLTYSAYTVEKLVANKKDISSETKDQLIRLEKECLKILLNMVDILGEQH